MPESGQRGGLYDTDDAGIDRIVDDVPHLFFVLALHGMELADYSVQYSAGGMLVLEDVLGVGFGLCFVGVVRRDGGNAYMGPCVSGLAAYYSGTCICGGTC